MQDRKLINNDKIKIYISKYGNEVTDFHWEKNIPELDDYYHELKAETCNTYDKVLNFLKKIKSLPEQENFVIFHRYNTHYEGHSPHKDGTPHKESIDSMIAFIEKRKTEEKLSKIKQIGDELFKFKHAILELESKVGNADPVIRPLLHLHETLTKEILEKDTYYPKNTKERFPQSKNYICPRPFYLNRPTFKGPDLNKTFYHEIIKHFTDLTQQFTKNPETITSEKIEASSNRLYAKLYNKPVSNPLKSAILGALIGFSIGAAAGLTATWWCGGLGALIGAASGAVIGSSINFFSARSKQKKFDIKDGNAVTTKNDNSLKTERDIATDAMNELVNAIEHRSMR